MSRPTRTGRRPSAPLSPSSLALGQKMRRLRERRRLTGEMVHRATGICPTSLSFIERGRQNVTWTQLVALAGALGTTVPRLVSLPPSSS